jgi:hypothetical protein
MHEVALPVFTCKHPTHSAPGGQLLPEPGSPSPEDPGRHSLLQEVCDLPFVLFPPSLPEVTMKSTSTSRPPVWRAISVARGRILKKKKKFDSLGPRGFGLLTQTQILPMSAQTRKHSPACCVQGGSCWDQGAALLSLRQALPQGHSCET